MKSIPQFLKKYFWDVDFQKLDKKKYSQFIIERILEYGENEKAINWLFRNFTKSEIVKVVTKGRNLSPLSANYWGLVFGIPKTKILCLQKQFQKKLQKIWPY